MKNVCWFLPGILLGIIFPFHVFSQCANGAPASTLVYDTAVMGNGSSSRDFTFPKFDPSIGTLLSADIKAVVSTSYSYTLQNQDVTNHTYKVKILRSDDISSDALDPSTISVSHSTAYINTPTLVPGQVFTYGSAYLNYTVTNSVTDSRLVNFMGVGTVDFDYEAGTSANVVGTPPFGLNFSTALDTTVFSLTYRYCASSLLSSDLLFFSATPLKGKVALNWRQLNIENGRLYNVQVSTDGKNFKIVASVDESNAGVYAYTYLSNASSRIYFRLEEKNTSGEIKYSNIRIIDPEQSVTNAHVYPTLYNGGNLQVDFPFKADWQINLYSADGKRVSESRQANAYNAQITLPSAISNGTYTAEIFNIQTQQKQFTRIIVQR